MIQRNILEFIFVINILIIQIKAINSSIFQDVRYISKDILLNSNGNRKNNIIAQKFSYIRNNYFSHFTAVDGNYHSEQSDLNFQTKTIINLC